MARPKTKDLTERELEVMQVIWERVAEEGRDLAYTTVATLVKILLEKNYLEQTNSERPFRYAPIRTFEEVSGNLLGDLVSKVFGGSREKLLVRLMDERQLTSQERKVLEDVMKEADRGRK
jgi:predicted transcriptional regulator